MRRPNVRWTADMDEYLVKKRLEGIPCSKIAFVLGVCRGSAQKRFKTLLPTPPATYVRRVKVHDLSVRQAVIEMKREGKKLSVIARKLGLRVNQVHGIWNHWRDYEQPRRNAA